ncbi:hypothetical protein bcgnr5369_14630 [Bacillus cereus]
MEVRGLHPKKHHTYIFVNFPGVKMNHSPSNNDQLLEANETSLCIELDRRQQVKSYFLVKDELIQLLEAPRRRKTKKSSFLMVELVHSLLSKKETKRVVHVLSDEASIVQQATPTGHEYVLVINEQEVAVIATIEIKEKVAMTVGEKEEYAQQLITEKQNESMKQKSALHQFIESYLRQGVKSLYGVRMLQVVEIANLMRITNEENKGQVIGYNPAALEFIGPGDFTPPPRNTCTCACESV